MPMFVLCSIRSEIASRANRPCPPATPNSMTETLRSPSTLARAAPCMTPQAYGGFRAQRSSFSSSENVWFNHGYIFSKGTGGQLSPRDLARLKYRTIFVGSIALAVDFSAEAIAMEILRTEWSRLYS